MSNNPTAMIALVLGVFFLFVALVNRIRSGRERRHQADVRSAALNGGTPESPVRLESPFPDRPSDSSQNAPSAAAAPAAARQEPYPQGAPYPQAPVPQAPYPQMPYAPSPYPQPPYPQGPYAPPSPYPPAPYPPVPYPPAPVPQQPAAPAAQSSQGAPDPAASAPVPAEGEYVWE